MSRRGSPAVQVLIVIVVVLIFLYGFYSYHQQHTRLKLSEELNDKFKQKAESLSAQLQVLYEHKTRLETGLQKEKELHKATKENLELQMKELENKYSREKELCTVEFESCKKGAEESKLALEKADQESKRLLQEHQIDIARLKDDLANNKRRLEECESRVQKPDTPAVGKSKSQLLPPSEENDNKNFIKNGGGVIDAQSMQIVKPVDAELSSKQKDKADSVPQNIPMDAAQGVLQPDGRAVQKVDAPMVRSNGDSNQPQRNNERSRLDIAEVDGVKPLAVKNQVPDPLVSSLEQLKQQPENVKENLRLPASSNKVSSAEKKNVADANDYEDDIQGQQENGALVFRPEGNDADKVANVDVQHRENDGAGL